MHDSFWQIPTALFHSRLAPPIVAAWPHGADDFHVEELPLYPTSGEGEHCFMQVRKTNLAAGALLSAVGRFFKLPAKQVGYAGLKDTWATTTQWLSLPRAAVLARQLTPESLVGAELHPQVEVLAASWHRNRLRCGHLAENRFMLRLRPASQADAAAIAQRLEQLGRAGLANFFGPQRMGPGGRTVASGLALLTALQAGERGPGMPGWRRRLLLSAVQSALFNRVLARRLTDGSLRQALLGDVMQVRASGGLFTCDDVDHCQDRLERGLIGVAGPIFGPSMVAAAGAPRELERAVLAEACLQEDIFTAGARLTQGTRRPLTVQINEPRAEVVSVGEDETQLMLRFGLPPGSYASMLWAQLGLEAPARAAAAAAAGSTPAGAAEPQEMSAPDMDLGLEPKTSGAALHAGTEPAEVAASAG